MHSSPVTDQPQSALNLIVDELLASLQSNSNGLSAEEAVRRLRDAGRNELPRHPPIPWWRILLRQLRNPIICILGLAAAAALVAGEPLDAAFIAGVVVLNSLIGGFQEFRADRSARALQQLLQIRAVVLRDGVPAEIDSREVVPGDIVLLESGNRVPADMRLLWTQALEIDESFLTGESLATAKDAQTQPPERAPAAEQANMAFAGSLVVRGRGRGLVTATGLQTEVGRLALDVMHAPVGQPPLLLRLERFTRALGVIVLIAAALVGAAGVLLHGFSHLEMFGFAVALAVSAIPEGLPVAITVALAVAAWRMARRGVIVRRLHAVEGLGSCTFVASDKTGTLTCNQLTVREIRLADGLVLEVTGEGFVPEGAVEMEGEPLKPGRRPAADDLLRAAVLCNEANLHRAGDRWSWHGDPTDVALLSAAHKAGWEAERVRDEFPLADQIPFEPERRYAATFHQQASGIQIVVKGAPERVLPMCDVDAIEKGRLLQEAETMAGRGLRVLALAERSTAEDQRDRGAPAEPGDLQFLGFAGMIDPLRPGAREAVCACTQAGIRVVMVTGDHPTTALAIARDLGLAERDEQVLSGNEVESAGMEQRAAIIERIRVFARVAPHQKLQIVQAAQFAGHLVAVTGDGVNDAPALRAANAGVAMGRSGTDVAREASDLIISDDNFATIVAGVEEGRVAYDNIRKVIFLLASTGAAEVAVVALAVLAGTPIPLLPVQLLWLNLVTNGIQDVALSLEPGEGDVMQRGPRPSRERIFDRLMVVNTLTSAAVMGIVGFGAFLWMLSAGWSDAAARNGLLLLMVLFEFVHIGNCRSETKSAFHLSPLRSPFLLFGALGALGLHAVMLYLPIGQKLLRTEPVPMKVWIALSALALLPMVALELQKIWRRQTTSPSLNPLHSNP